jgi:hypothetical protein
MGFWDYNLLRNSVLCVKFLSTLLAKEASSCEVEITKQTPNQWTV